MKKKLSEDQIQDMVGRREKSKFALLIAVFLAMVVNLFYLFLFYKGGENETLLNFVEISDVVLVYAAYFAVVGYVRNEVTDVSYFLWYMDGFISSKGKWDFGRKPFMFVKQWRMFPSFEELKNDVEELKKFYSRRRFWAIVSVVVSFPLLLCVTALALFSGNSASVYEVWTQDVAQSLFLVPAGIFSVILFCSVFWFVHYREKVRILASDPAKSSLTSEDLKGIFQ